MLNPKINFKEKKSGFLKNSRGFTLVETLVAIVIITVGLLGAIALIIYAISVASLVKGKLIASQLAQEGVEVVRNMRDNNWLAGKIGDGNWYDGLNVGLCVPILSGDDPSSKWGLVKITSEDDSESIVYFDKNNKFYGQSSNVPTSWQAASFNLRRWLNVSYDSTNKRLEITSHVSWSEKGRDHSFEIKDYLYNWQKGAGICPAGYTESSAGINGISYYSGSEDSACTGQEIILSKRDIPYRPFSQTQSVCVSDTPSSQRYCSARSSSALCDKIDCETADVYFVVDPL